MHYELSVSKTATGQAAYALTIDDQLIFCDTGLRNSLEAKDVASEYLAARGLRVEPQDIEVRVLRTNTGH